MLNTYKLYIKELNFRGFLGHIYLVSANLHLSKNPLQEGAYMYRISGTDGEIRVLSPCGGRKFVVVSAETAKGAKPPSLSPGDKLVLLSLAQAAQVLSHPPGDIRADKDGTLFLSFNKKGGFLELLFGAGSRETKGIVPASCPTVGYIGWNSSSAGGHLTTSVITKVEEIPS